MPRLKPNIRNFSDLLTDLNRILEGYDQELKLTPRLTREGNLDLRGKRIMRVGQTKARDDVPGRKELERRGLYETPKGDHVAHSNVIVTGGIRSTRRAVEPDELVPLRQVEDMVGLGSNDDAVVTTNVDQVIAGYKFFRGIGFSSFTAVLGAGLTNQINTETSGAPTGVICRITGGAAASGGAPGFSLGGLRRDASNEGGEFGQILILHNATNNPMALIHENAGTAAASRLRIPQGTPTSIAGMNIRRYGSVMLVYSGTDSRWLVASFA